MAKHGGLSINGMATNEPWTCCSVSWEKKRASWIWVFWGSSILTIIHLWWSRPGHFTWWFQILQKSLGTSLSGQGKGLKQIWSILTKINVPPIMAVSEHLVTVYYEICSLMQNIMTKHQIWGTPVSDRQTHVVIQSMKLPYVKYCQHVFGHFLPNTSVFVLAKMLENGFWGSNSET